MMENVASNGGQVCVRLFQLEKCTQKLCSTDCHLEVGVLFVSALCDDDNMCRCYYNCSNPESRSPFINKTE
ncbi:hypothetical protein HPP92_012046 [Vanilla planifolia]|uniref:Uncharacterized protein n=1 Tax=Vanilla planifolia TaxID=51239 RepID=A0A835RCV3_VANPL|nr:hypothetical protein HPP92_012046 [Vanilla planifolia]